MTHFLLPFNSRSHGARGDGPEQPGQHVFYELGPAVCQQHAYTHPLLQWRHAPLRNQQVGRVELIILEYI